MSGLTDEQILQAIFKVNEPVLTEALTYTTWKDGIDIEVITSHTRNFAYALVEASQEIEV